MATLQISRPVLLDSDNTSLSELVILLRLVLALVLGAVIGFEREWRDRPAGLRTHMLTALASSVFAILTIEIHHTVAREAGNNNSDPIRIIEAVTAGAVGVACGLGFYVVASVATLLAAFVLAVMRRLEHQIGVKGPIDDGGE